MHWFLSALLSAIGYAVVVFVDKHIVSNKLKDYRGMPIYTTIAGVIAGTTFWVVFGFPVLSFRDAILLLLSGVFTIWAAYTYFKAISLEEASYVNILMQTMPIFVIVSAFFFLKETISIKQLIGFIIIFVSLLPISYKKTKKKFSFSAGFWLMIVSNIFWAISVLLVKFAIDANSFTKILSYESWGVGIGGALLYVIKPVRQSFHRGLRTAGVNVLTMVFLNEGMFILSKALQFLAFATGPVALVSVVGNTQAFFGIIYGGILTIVFPKYFHEKIQRKDFVKKILSAIGLFIGLSLLI